MLNAKLTLSKTKFQQQHLPLTYPLIKDVAEVVDAPLRLRSNSSSPDFSLNSELVSQQDTLSVMERQSHRLI